MSVSDIYANARALAGYLREKSAEIDAARGCRPRSSPDCATPECSA